MTEEEKWIQTCERDQAWQRVRINYIENGMNEDAKWKRCFKISDKIGMDDSCWTDLIAAFPAE